MGGRRRKAAKRFFRRFRVTPIKRNPRRNLRAEPVDAPADRHAIAPQLHICPPAPAMDEPRPAAAFQTFHRAQPDLSHDWGVAQTIVRNVRLIRGDWTVFVGGRR